jgi:hypothetical protein
MHRPVIKNTLLSLVLLGGALACASEQQKAETPADAVQNASAGVQTRSAAESIAESRCERERHCDNIGENKKYSSASECLSRIRADWKDDLNARECPDGVQQSQLDECLSKIRSEDCGSPFDTLSRVAECTSGQICKG